MPKKGHPRRNGASEQIELLRGIWNEIKTLGQTLGGRIDQTNARLDQTNARLDAVRTELKGEIGELRAEFKEELDQLRHVMVESDVRLATEVRELSGSIKTVTATIRQWRAEDRQRISRLEERAGIGHP